MSRIAQIEKPLRRRIGRMVVEIGPHGIRLRAFGRRTWHQVTWEQVAALDNAGDQQETLSRSIDTRVGTELLKALKIIHGS